MSSDQAINFFRAEEIVKSFPGVRALDQVDFEARSGEVHAIVGANGAGKSTLAKVLAGVYIPDSGRILINGEPITMHGPYDAKHYGIACAYQEVDTALVGYLSVTENVLMNRLVETRRPMLNWPRLHKDARQLLERVDLTGIDVRKPIREFSLHERQKVVIAQAIELNAKFLILDEPTAPLGLREVEQLFKLIRSLTSGGMGVIYISHRMAEVYSIADKITVLRDGKRVDTVPTKETTPDQVVYMMLEKTFTQVSEHQQKASSKGQGAEIFRADALSRPPLVNQVSFCLHKGEVLGITGLVGAGKTELARVLFGADRLASGTIHLNGRPVHFHSPAEAVSNGVMLVPEERRKQGILVELPVTHNLTLPSLTRLSTAGLINRRKEKTVATRAVQDLRIICRSVDQEVKFLSGGNQQKVSVGKWIVSSGQVYIFDEPTKGVDLGAKEEIFRLVNELAASGAAVIYFSSEIPEILRMSDRILVLYDGQVMAELDRSDATEDVILRYATGGGKTNGHS